MELMEVLKEFIEFKGRGVFNINFLIVHKSLGVF